MSTQTFAYVTAACTLATLERRVYALQLNLHGPAIEMMEAMLCF